MRGIVVAGACLVASAACVARAPEPVERPRAEGPPPAVRAKQNQRIAELAGVSAFHWLLDPRQPPGQTPQLVPEALPPAPFVRPPVRPHVRGDALHLADLALHRGDALDAAAQYRALLERRDPAIAGYVNVQLAQAYLALGDVDRATRSLAAAVHADDTAWYALAQLASLRVRGEHATTVLKQLAPLLPSRVDDLENLLVQLAAPGDVGDVLAAKVRRNPRDPYACGYALAAIARGADQRLYVDAACAPELERAEAMARREPWLDTRNPCRRLLAANVALWQTEPGNRDPALWLDAADRAVHAIALAQDDADTKVASLNAVFALLAVVRLSADDVPLDGAAIARFRAVFDTLPPRWQRPVYGYAHDDPQLRAHISPPPPPLPPPPPPHAPLPAQSIAP
jgi:hypothetical protein